MTIRLSIPPVSLPAVAPAINAIKEVLEVGLGVRGDPNDRFLRVADLTSIGLASSTRRGLVATNPATGEAVDLTPPAALTGLTASGAFTAIILEWYPSTAHNYSYAEIWRASSNDRNLAVRVGTALGTLYSDSVDVGGTYYYWVRAVSTADVIGPWNAAYDAGVVGATSEATATLMAQLTEQIRPGQVVWREQVVYETDLFAIVSPRAGGDSGLKVPFIVGTINGASTVGVNGQLLVDGTITANAIQAGAVTATKISVSTLSAISANMGALTAGSAEVGSGTWKVRIADTGYPISYRNTSTNEYKFYLDAAGNAYFKGAIEATSGTFAGAVQSGSTVTGATISGGTLDIGAPGFHVAANGDAWLGHASYASAPLRLETGGALHSGLGSSSTHMQSGQLWTGSSSFSSAPFRVDSAGNLVATSIAQARMNTDVSGQPEITNLYMEAAKIKNLTADKIQAGTLQAGVLLSGAGIFGSITTATLAANRLTGYVDTVVRIHRSGPLTLSGVGSWETFIGAVVSAPQITSGHRIHGVITVWIETSAKQLVAARLRHYQSGVVFAIAQAYCDTQTTLCVNHMMDANLYADALVYVEVATLSGASPCTIHGIYGTIIGKPLISYTTDGS